MTLRQQAESRMQAAGPPPADMFQLAGWLNEVFGPGVPLLTEIEKEVGEEAANRWLTSVLVSTGVYASTDGETVSPAP